MPDRLTAWRALCAGLLLTAGRAAAAPPDDRPKVAVVDLVANGASPSLASAAGGAVASELDRLGAFKVISSDNIRAMLALERQRQILGGCADAGCVTEIGGALGADYLVSGQVSAVGGSGSPVTYGIDLTLSSVKKGAREGSAVESARTESELMQLLPRAVGKLTARVLASRSGRLVLVASEAGAAVKVDDQVRGTTPLPGPLELPSGPRSIAVEKQGFVTWQADLVIHPGRIAEEHVALVPSPDFIQQYESRNGKMRLGAWVATGTAAAGALAAVVFQLRANQLYGDSTTSGTFLYYKQKLIDGAVPPPGVDYRQQAERLQGRVSTAQNLSYAGAGLLAVGAGAAAWLWVAGDDPDRYARYRGLAASIAPARGAASLALAGEF
jgi:hypothetical protein